MKKKSYKSRLLIVRTASDIFTPIALVLGSEGSGVSPLVKSLCDGVLSLPMAGGGTGVDSFNVSVATGIILYEIMRQRGTEGSI